MRGELVHRAAWKAGVMGALSTIAAVTSQRLIVLIAALGAIALGYIALDGPDVFKLGVLAIYCAGVVIPAVWLARG